MKILFQKIKEKKKNQLLMMDMKNYKEIEIKR